MSRRPMRISPRFPLAALAFALATSACDEVKREFASRPPEVDTAAVMDSFRASIPEMPDVNALLDSIHQEVGLTSEQVGDRTVVTMNGKRIVFGPDGIDVDSLPAEAVGGETPDLATNDPAEFVPAAEAAWKPVERWSREGDYTTPPFRVRSAEWRVVATGRSAPPIRWRTVNVKDQFGQRVTMMRPEAPGSDTTYVHRGPGTFQIEISRFEGPWTLRVEEKMLPAERAAQP
jgi:hypothetical protein